MKQIGLILPDDLSSNNEVLKSINKSDPLLLYEPCDTFYQLHHHKHKIVLLISRKHRIYCVFCFSDFC